VIGLSAVCLGIVAVVMLLRPERRVQAPRAPDAPPDAPAQSTDTAPERAAPSPPPPQATPENPPRSRVAKLRALRAAGIEPQRGPDGKRELDAAPVIEALNAAGVHEGIGAFPPPGTDPPKSGIIVPDDFPLPEGYLRHYQSSDDGEELPPILLFHPDYEFFDEAGNRITIPPDRVVPPELAPPGLPVKTLEIPARRR
jgi:hypothetical protein